MTSPTIQVPYNHELKPLERLLSGVRRRGAFFAQGSLEVPMPRLEVEGVGLVSFPVPEPQIQRLIRQAVRAPYGRGEETILDESVRKVWQLAPEGVRLGGKSWDATFQQVLASVADGLGCDPAAVSAELYKLLLYDQGGFFKAHRDTEKAEGMFGTLVVVLPSLHEGGALVIRHAGREEVVDMAGREVSELRFAAFYADCEHEVRPITAGYRVCLIYNLVQRSVGKQKSPLVAPLYDAEAKAAARLLRDAFGATGAPAKLAWLLDHQYSPAGLSFDGLKGADSARAKVLERAAQEADCAVHLGTVHLRESGPAEPTYARSFGRRSRWRSYDDGVVGEQEGVASESFEVVEISEVSRFVDQWRDIAGGQVDFGRLPLAEGEVLPAGALDDQKPDEQRLMEATGNEGASFERSYHRAAVVIWPKARFVDVLLQAGAGASLPYLAERVAACGASAERRASAVAIARRIVEFWETAPYHSMDFTSGSLRKEASRVDMLRLLAELGDLGLLNQFVVKVVTDRFDGSEVNALASAIKVLGPEQGGEAGLGLLLENTLRFPQACIALLRRLSPAAGKDRAAWKAALRKAAALVVAALPKLEPPAKSPWSPDWQRLRAATPVDAASVIALFESLRAVDAAGLGARAAAAVAANTAVFDPVTVIVPALAGLCRSAAAASAPDCAALWRDAAGFLLARSEQPPAAPVDWRQQVDLSCKCEDCRELQAFARDAGQTVHRFRIRQDRRQHLHGQIDVHGLDMTHETERKGSPQTLVCTKTRATYQRECARHAADCQAMETLLGPARPAAGNLPELLARLDAARQREPQPCGG